MARAALLPPIPLHGLRHTYATLALASGVNPRIVSGRLGHATVALTLDVYSHVLPQADREAAETHRGAAARQGVGASLRGVPEALQVTGKAASVFAMTGDHGSSMRSLPDRSASPSGPSARPLPAAPGALPRHAMTTLMTACLTISQPSESHRFRAEARHLRVSARPKGPFYCRELALSRPSCEAKSLHLVHFRGRQQGRISALNCTITVGIASAGQLLSFAKSSKNSLHRGTFWWAAGGSNPGHPD